MMIHKTRTYLTAFLMISLPFGTYAVSRSRSGNPVLINEFPVSGTTLCRGQEWIELFNTSDEPVSMTGYEILSAAEKGKRRSSRLDSLTIPAKSFLVLKQGVHFNFSIHPEKGSLILKKNGKAVDQIAFELNRPDHSYGRIKDGETIGWTLFDTASSSIGSSNHTFSFIYTSDQHYGIKRDFRGEKKVDASDVNRAMVAQMNRLVQTVLPDDEGVNANLPVQVDYLIQTGDITSRSDKPQIPKASVMMEQFENDYLRGITLTDGCGDRIPVFLTAGNHDLSNAIGHAKIPADKVDNTAMITLYNLMMNPDTLLTGTTYDYRKERVNYIRNLRGVQFLFIQMWPDSDSRAWLETQMDTEKPTFLFTHDQPDIEAKHLIDPVSGEGNTLSFGNKFENLVNEKADPGSTTAGSTDTQQRGLADFLKRHPNIGIYFHGNENFNEFYTYRGPDNDLSLPVIRVDSPMKGNHSAEDERLLSFQLVTVDKSTRRLTVRELYWNSTANSDAPLTYGSCVTLPY